jgi:NADH-quinone oxidoreductase subunit C
VTESQSESAPTEAADLAERFASIVGSETWSAEFGTPKVRVTVDRWVEAHQAAKEHLPFFSWLGAVDWAAEVAVGDPPDGDVEERYEVISCLSDVTQGDFVLLSTQLSKDDPTIPTLVEVFGGANWHEREAAEMFGIVFDGHPNLKNLYLPDEFEGHPLRKTFPLLSREVKPWPGTVDVEDMPSATNEEAGDEDGDEDEVAADEDEAAGDDNGDEDGTDDDEDADDEDGTDDDDDGDREGG